MATTAKIAKEEKTKIKMLSKDCPPRVKIRLRNRFRKLALAGEIPGVIKASW
jgi:ribosomal protein S14